MGSAKQKIRLRRRRNDKELKLPDRWLVHGRDKNGERIHTSEEDKALAEHIAAGINGRGGEVEVIRCIFNGPKAAWIPVKAIPDTPWIGDADDSGGF